jgi:hypothetical protein
MAVPRHLHVFDFDGTLFKSPEMPSGWTGNNWYGHQDSLGRPYVPDDPDSSWWVGSTVAVAKQSIADPEVVAVLATGRAKNSFARWRLPELLRSHGLDFDYVLLAPTTGVAAAFKKAVVTRLLQRYHTVESVTLWEDTKANIPGMQQAAEGLPFEVHLVKVDPKEVVYIPESPDPSTVASLWRARSSG